MNKIIHPYLIHHGIKGQIWGVRNGPPYPLDDHPSRQYGRKSYNIHYKYSGMTQDEYAVACDAWNSVKELPLAPDIKRGLESALNTKLASDDYIYANQVIVYGSHRYWAITKGIGEYKVYNKVKIPGTDYSEDDIFDEIFGPYWRDW